MTCDTYLFEHERQEWIGGEHRHTVRSYTHLESIAYREFFSEFENAFASSSFEHTQTASIKIYLSFGGCSRVTPIDWHLSWTVTLLKKQYISHPLDGLSLQERYAEAN